MKTIRGVNLGNLVGTTDWGVNTSSLLRAWWIAGVLKIYVWLTGSVDVWTYGCLGLWICGLSAICVVVCCLRPVTNRHACMTIGPHAKTPRGSSVTRKGIGTVRGK